MNSSELLRHSAARPPFYELDAVSDENSRRKLQNVVVNRMASWRKAATEIEATLRLNTEHKA